MSVPPQSSALTSELSFELQELSILPDLLNGRSLLHEDWRDALPDAPPPPSVHRVKFVPLLSAPAPDVPASVSVPDDDCSSWLNSETLPAEDNRKIFPDQLNMAYWRLQTHFGVNPWSPDSVIRFNSPAGLQDAITACVYNLKDGTSVVGVRFGVGSGEVQLDLLGIVRDLYSKVIDGIPVLIGDSDARRLQRQIWDFVWEMFPVVSSANSTPPVGGFDDLSATSPKLTKELFLSGEDVNGLAIIPFPNYIGLDGLSIKVPLEEIIEIFKTHASYPIYPIMPGGSGITGTGPDTVAVFCSNASLRRLNKPPPFSDVKDIYEVLYGDPFPYDVNSMNPAIWRAGPVIGCYSPIETSGKGQVMLYAGGAVDVMEMTDFILESMGLGPDSWSPIKTELKNFIPGTHVILPTISERGKIFVALGDHLFELSQLMRVVAAYTLPNEAGVWRRTLDSLQETGGGITSNLIIEALALLTVLRVMLNVWNRTGGRIFR